MDDPEPGTKVVATIGGRERVGVVMPYDRGLPWCAYPIRFGPDDYHLLGTEEFHTQGRQP
jgi:hypothetical protein